MLGAEVHRRATWAASDFSQALRTSGLNWVIIESNNDEGSKFIRDELGLLDVNPHFKVIPSMRFAYFLSLFKSASMIVGNSSTGVREAPHYGVPSVNVGTRQDGRANSKMILNVSNDQAEILQGISLAKSLERICDHNFGDGQSAERFNGILMMESTWRIPLQKKIFLEQNGGISMTKGRYGLPLEVRFCSRCVISNQRPSSTVEFRSAAKDTKTTIYFDENGLCDACGFHEQKEKNIDWEAREQELHELSERLSSRSGYNVVVPGSGGKDSAFTAHILKYKYGFRPLTVTWAPHLYTEVGWKNFTNWTHVGGLDNLLFTPNGRLHRHLTKLAFTNLLHPFQPFIIGQRAIGPIVAKRFDIPLVFYGENQAEYGNASSENASPNMKNEFFTAKGSNDLLFGGVSVSSILRETDFVVEDFAPYTPISVRDVQSMGIEVRYLGYYLKWDPQECFYYAAENTGFKPNPERTEGTFSTYISIDDKIDPFHYYTTFAKFGIGRASYEAAQEIRNGKITRSEGVELVKQFDSEFPSKYFDVFLDYIGITEDEFHQTVDSFRPDHLWRKSRQGWELINPIWKAS